jgi:O-antigen/teichoic acid export membrane protein
MFQASRLVVGLVAAAVLTPRDYGAWGLVLAWLGYGVYANLGILSGANREIPRHLGAGEPKDADRVEQAAFGSTLIVSIATVAVGLPAALAISGGGVAVRLLVVLAVAIQQIHLFYQTSLRSRLEFNRASVVQGLLAIAFPLGSLPFLRLMGVSALVLGQVVSLAVAVVVVAALWRRTRKPSLDARTTRRLIAVGLPIMTAGIAYSLFTTADRWLTLWLLGAAALGSYTLAAILSSALLLLALVVAQQLYPRMAMRFGADGTAAAVWPMAVQQGLLIFALLLPLVLLIALVIPVAIQALLPAYRASIPAVVLLPFGFLMLTAGSGFTNLLVTVGRSGTYLACLGTGLMAESLAAAFFVSRGLGLTGIAAAACIGFATATSLSAAAAYRATRA